MTRIAFAAITALVAIASASAGVHAAPVPAAKDLVWAEVGPNRYAADLTLDAVTQHASDQLTFTTRAYNGAIPGPVLRMRRCATYDVTLRNALAYTPPPRNPWRTLSRPQWPNTTSLYLHGVHVSADPGANDVLTGLEAGGNNVAHYTYQIPCDHAGGTFMYRAAYHGSAQLQTVAGAAGVLIIEDDAKADGLPAWWQELAATERVLVLTHFDPPSLVRLGFDAGDHLFRSTLMNTTYLVNGVVQPTLELAAGHWTRLRIGHTKFGGSAVLSLEPAGVCELQVMAKDGVTLGASPRAVHRLVLSPMSRVDVAIRCSPGADTADVTLHAFDVLQNTRLPVLHVHVTARQPPKGSATGVLSELLPFAPHRPWYLSSLTDAALAITGEKVCESLTVWLGTQSIGAVRWGAADGSWAVPRNTTSLTRGYVPIRDAPLSAETIYELQFRTDVQTTVYGQAVHLHTYPMQLIAPPCPSPGTRFPTGATPHNLATNDTYCPLNGTSTPYHQPGDWLDTALLPQTFETPLRMRFRTTRFGGALLVQTQTAYTEENGAIGVYGVAGGTRFNPSAAPGAVIAPARAAVAAATNTACVKPPAPAISASTCPNVTFTWEQISRHNNRSDLWLVVGQSVYNMTQFVWRHPGGWQPFVTYAGHDASKVFYEQNAHMSSGVDLLTRVKCEGVTDGTPDPWLVVDTVDPSNPTPTHTWQTLNKPFKPTHTHATGTRSDPGVAVEEDNCGRQFDYIVIGAGTSGSAVAWQLSNDPANRVLLIEEGGWARYDDRGPQGVWNASVWFPTVENLEMRRNYTSTPQPHFANRTIWQPRARIVGGCSAHNAHVLMHPNANDFRNWSLDNPEWDWRFLAPYGQIVHKRYRAFVADDLPHYPQLDQLMSVCDELGISQVEHPSPLWQKGCNYRRHIDTREWVFPANSSTREANWWLKRQTVFSQFIAPVLPSRPNLQLLTDTRVLKLLFRGHEAIGVQVVPAFGGTPYSLTARREVILSAGVFNSPQLLMLSGIGPRAHLESLGIPVLVDNPAVGEHLVDDGFCILAGPLLKDQDVDEHGNWRGSQQYDKYPTAGLQIWYPDDGDALTPPRFNVNLDVGVNGNDRIGAGKVSFHANLEPVCQRSGGVVRLATTDPADAPIIDPRYNTDPDDKAKWLEAFDLAVRTFRSKVVQDMAGGPGAPSMDPSEEVINGGESARWNWIQQHCDGTNGHPQGTCRMGKRSDSSPGSVVDSRLRVYGVKRLRVVDASIHPIPIHGNTNQPALIVGLHGGTLIREDNAKDPNPPPVYPCYDRHSHRRQRP